MKHPSDNNCKVFSFFKTFLFLLVAMSNQRFDHLSEGSFTASRRKQIQYNVLFIFNCKVVGGFISLFSDIFGSMDLLLPQEQIKFLFGVLVVEMTSRNTWLSHRPSAN